MIPRFFCELRLRVGAIVELPPDVARHALRTLRLRAGEPIVLFDGRGGEHLASLLDSPRRPSARIETFEAIERESPLKVTLAQALPAGDKMDWVIQKSVELGVAAIVPLISERSVVRLAGERADKRAAHLRRVVRAACEQCGRNTIPVVEAIRPLGDFLGSDAPQDELRLVLSPGGRATLANLARPEHGIVLLVGPEGGWSDPETAVMRATGWTEMSLGPRVLRSETAGPAALAAMQACWGDF